MIKSILNKFFNKKQEVVIKESIFCLYPKEQNQFIMIEKFLKNIESEFVKNNPKILDGNFSMHTRTKFTLKVELEEYKGD